MPKEQEETRVDHRAEAQTTLAAVEEDIARGNTSNLGIGLALIHSQLAVADELKGIREAIGDCLGDGSNVDQIAQALRAIAEPAKYGIDPRTLPIDWGQVGADIYCPNCQPEQGGDGDWPELWIQRGDPERPETWRVWGSTAGDAVPYEFADGTFCRYVPAPTQPSISTKDREGLKELARVLDALGHGASGDFLRHLASAPPEGSGEDAELPACKFDADYEAALERERIHNKYLANSERVALRLKDEAQGRADDLQARLKKAERNEADMRYAAQRLREKQAALKGTEQ